MKRQHYCTCSCITNLRYTVQCKNRSSNSSLVSVGRNGSGKSNFFFGKFHPHILYFYNNVHMYIVRDTNAHHS